MFPFSSGSFLVTDKRGVPQETVFNEGALGFLVNMNLEQIDFDRLPPAVKDAIKNLGPGMFSMRQLLLDFQSAAMAGYDEKSTRIPAGLTDAKRFRLGFSSYLMDMEESGGNVLGYAVEVKNPNELAPESPTLPPTALDSATGFREPRGRRAVRGRVGAAAGPTRRRSTPKLRFVSLMRSRRSSNHMSSSSWRELKPLPPLAQA